MGNKGGMGACAGGSALFALKNEHSHEGKIRVLEELMQGCAKSKIKEAKKEGSITKKEKLPKEKRAMTGYNCYMKICAKNSGNFGKCLTDKGWGKLTDNEKENYNKMAVDGCNG